VGLIVDTLTGDVTMSGWFLLLLLTLAALAGALIVAGLQEDPRPPRAPQRANERPMRPPQQRRPGPIEQHRRIQEAAARRHGPPRMDTGPVSLSWIWRDQLSAGLLEGARID
jgi:hypothetical protein